jgi:hypothetical protein
MPLLCFGAFGPVRFHGDRGVDRLGHAVKYVGAKGSGPFQEIAQNLRRNARLGGNLAYQASAPMNSSAKMPAKRIFLFRFKHSVMPIIKLRQLTGNCLTISPQLF